VLIGLDLDNTIIDYDAAFVRVGGLLGLLPEGFEGQKRDVRNYLRGRGEGDFLWQQLQAEVYGPMIGDAVPSNGLRRFIGHCRARRFDLAVVSHKTAFAAADRSGTNLRSSALEWLRDHELSPEDEAGIGQIYFANTRAEKIEIIRALSCAYFVDDLEEVLLAPAFPPETTGIFYSPRGAVSRPAKSTLKAYRSWDEIEAFIMTDSGRSRE
jgi:hypothetical protein